MCKYFCFFFSENIFVLSLAFISIPMCLFGCLLLGNYSYQHRSKETSLMYSLIYLLCKQSISIKSGHNNIGLYYIIIFVTKWIFLITSIVIVVKCISKKWQKQLQKEFEFFEILLMYFKSNFCYVLCEYF